MNQVNFSRPWKGATVTRERGQERGPYRASGSCYAGHAGAWTLPARGSATPVTRERGPYRLGVMLRRSRGSVDPTGLG